MVYSLGNLRLSLLACTALLKGYWHVKHKPFAIIAEHMGKNISPLPVPTVNDTDHDRHIKQVRWAIQAVCKRLPKHWQPTCLMQAIAAQHLLGKHRIPHQVFFGVAPVDPNTNRPQTMLSINAHAWLQAGTIIVTGAAQAQQYKPLACFDKRY